MREKKTPPELRVLNPARTGFLTKKCRSVTEADKHTLYWLECMLLKFLSVAAGAGHLGCFSSFKEKKECFKF